MAEILAEHVRSTLDRHLKKVCADGPPAVRSGRAEELHALRVALKRLRYNVEFFRCLLGDEAQDALKLLALGQERLGTIADDDTFGRYYSALLGEIEPDDPRRSGVEARLRAVENDRDREVQTLRALWDGGEEKPYRERLTGCTSAALGSLSKDES